MCVAIRLIAVIFFVFTSASYALDRTGAGFYYPIGSENFDQACGTWLGRDGGNHGCYKPGGFYHIGVDMMTRDNRHQTYAVADGHVLDTNDSASSWGSTDGKSNSAVFILHYTDHGDPFVCIYGHIQRQVKKGDFVHASNPLGTTGDYIGGIHLHFGCSWGSEIQPTDTKHGRGWGRMTNNWWDAADKCSGKSPDTNCFVDPVNLIKTNHPATLIPKGEQGFYQAGGDYILQGSDRCDTANARFKIVGAKSDSWITKEVSQSEACPGVEKAIESVLQSAEDNGGVVKVDNIVDVKRAPWWSSWISPITTLWHSFFGLVQTPAALAADPSIQQQVAVYRTGQVYEIQGTGKQAVILTDGPGMHGDKAIDEGTYAEADPSETFAPAAGADASGTRSDLVITDLWTERSSKNQWNTIGWGDTVCFVAVSKNLGNKDVSRDIKITFYVSKGNREDKHPDPIGSEMIPAKYLAKARTAKATTKHCVDIHGDNYPSSYPGHFNFGAHIDPDNKEPESNEKNNWKGERLFELTENPHLSISQIWFSNPNAQPGEGVTVFVRIRNSGTPFASSKVNTQWRVQGPQYGPDPIIVGFDQTKQVHLGVDGEAQEEVSFVMPTVPGDYVFSAEVDYDFRTAQTDRGITTASLSFTIPDTGEGDVGGSVPDTSTPVSCPLITPGTWGAWSDQSYSPPFDWFEGNRLTITPMCFPGQPDRLEVKLGKDTDDSTMVVYRTVYIRNGITGLQSTVTVDCPFGELSPGSGYCKGGAYLSLSGAQADTSSLSQPTLILAYVCHAVDGVWRCGCKDASCSVSGYQQQAAALGE